MARDELYSYVKDALKSGHSKQKIKRILKKEGIQGKVVEEAFVKAESAFPWSTILLVLGIILIIGGLVYVVMTYDWAMPDFAMPEPVSEIKVCDTKECFIQEANLCGNAAWQSSEVGSTVTYSIEGCTLRKEITDFANNEPIEVREYFRGKTMLCPYDKGNFNSYWIETITGGLPSCRGSLKEAIIALRAAA
ncbi:MAG: hypothetical protein ACE5FT_00255 [Candidatus Nanoarchaeia archaeon]